MDLYFLKEKCGVLVREIFFCHSFYQSWGEELGLEKKVGKGGQEVGGRCTLER